MSNFLIAVEFDKTNLEYRANFADGQSVILDADNYEDAVCEAEFVEID